MTAARAPVRPPSYAPFAFDSVEPASHRETDRTLWSIAGGVALALHVAAIAGIIATIAPDRPLLPEPVVLVELPPEGGAVALQQPAVQTQELQPQPQPDVPQPPVDVPPAMTPPPRDAIVLPPSTQQTFRPAPQASPTAPITPLVSAPPAVRNGASPGNSDLTGNDPKSQKLEADYKSLVGSYIRRNRFSPPQSRKEGIGRVSAMAESLFESRALKSAWVVKST